MAALNFPDPNVTTSYTNADTGISYEWSNNVWKAVRSAQTAPELFVNAAGDNVTGNLTFGTDKIVLNATTGAASFASAVDATEFTVNGSPIGGAGSQTLVSDTMPTPGDYEVGTMWWNSEASDTSLYVLYQDPTGPNGDAGGKYWIEAAPAPDSIGFDGTHTGDSTFTGNMTVTGNINLYDGTFYAAGLQKATEGGVTYGQIYANKDNNEAYFTVTGNEGLRLGENIGSSVISCSIALDGSASFAGDVYVGSSYLTASGSLLVNGAAHAFYSDLNAGTSRWGTIAQISSSQQNIFLDARDGSASFAGAVQIDDRLSVRGLVDPDYAVNFANIAAGDFSVAGSKNLLIASGGAELGGVSAGAQIGWTVSGIKENAYLAFGGDYINPFFTFSDELRFGTTPDLTKTDPTIRLKTDGSATFASTIEASRFDIPAGTWSANGSDNAIYLGGFSSEGQWYDLGAFNPGTSSIPWGIKPDGSAYFAGGVNGDYFAASRNTTDANLLHAAFAYNNVITTLAKGTGIFLGTSLDNVNGATPTGTNLQLLTDGSAKFAGNVDIGTTSASQNGPILKVGTVNNTGSCIRTFVDYFHTRTHIDFFNGSTQQGSITGSNSSVSYNTSSDYRLKENVIDITDGITRVKQLQPKRFNFIDYADTTVDGFLAHEAQAVVPEAVTGTKDEVDNDGNAVMQGIDQSKLVPLLTAALQEAIAKIETLEVEVAALKAS